MKPYLLPLAVVLATGSVALGNAQPFDPPGTETPTATTPLSPTTIASAIVVAAIAIALGVWWAARRSRIQQEKP